MTEQMKSSSIITHNFGCKNYIIFKFWKTVTAKFGE